LNIGPMQRSTSYTEMSVMHIHLTYDIKGVMSVCLYAGDGRPNGWADRDQTWHGDSCFHGRRRGTYS